jgi:hypothetical protein
MQMIRLDRELLVVEGLPERLLAAGVVEVGMLRVGKSGTRAGRDSNGDKYRTWRRESGRVRVSRWLSEAPVLIRETLGWKNRLPAADAVVANVLGRLTTSPTPVPRRLLDRDDAAQP